MLGRVLAGVALLAACSTTPRQPAAPADLCEALLALEAAAARAADHPGRTFVLVVVDGRAVRLDGHAVRPRAPPRRGRPRAASATDCPLRRSRRVAGRYTPTHTGTPMRT